MTRPDPDETRTGQWVDQWLQVLRAAGTDDGAVGGAVRARDAVIAAAFRAWCQNDA